jgi:hypothetical protein
MSPTDKDAIQLTYRRTLTMRRPTFKLSNNIRYLDAAKLSKGSHSIELGRFEGAPCDCSVTATVDEGMITGIVYPKCKGATPIPEELEKEVRAARKKLAARRPKWEDVPVAEFIANRGVARAVITIIVDGDCFMLCVSVGGHESCVICCADWCIGPSEPTLAAF